MHLNVDKALFESSRRLHQDIDYFIDTFYVDFIASHSSIKDLFSGVSMALQREMLKHALVHIIGAVELPSSESEIRRLGFLHRNKLNVIEEHKRLFIASMLSAIEKVDPLVTVATMKDWEKLITHRLSQF